MEDIDLHENVIVLKGSFIERFDLLHDGILREQNLSVIIACFIGDFHPAGEEVMGKDTDLRAALKERLLRGRSWVFEFGMIFMEIQGFVALDTFYEERLT